MNQIPDNYVDESQQEPPLVKELFFFFKKRSVEIEKKIRTAGSYCMDQSCFRFLFWLKSKQSGLCKSEKSLAKRNETFSSRVIGWGTCEQFPKLGVLHSTLHVNEAFYYILLILVFAHRGKKLSEIETLHHNRFLCVWTLQLTLLLHCTWNCRQNSSLNISSVLCKV